MLILTYGKCSQQIYSKSKENNFVAVGKIEYMPLSLFNQSVLPQVSILLQTYYILFLLLLPLHDAGFWCEQSDACCLFCIPKRWDKERSSGETGLERAKETGVRKQRDSCCHVCAALAAQGQRRRGGRGRDKGQSCVFVAVFLPCTLVMMLLWHS